MTTPKAGARERRFVDSAGVSWVATEEPIPADEWTNADEQADGAGYGVGWLHFDCERHQPRRLRLYPKEWQSLTDAQLTALCRRARRTKAKR
jgi:NADH:ubiquinone oxidoreductase subunit